MISEEKSTFRGLLPAPVVERPRVDVRSGQACLREYGMPWHQARTVWRASCLMTLGHLRPEAALWSAAATAAPDPRCVSRGGQDRKL